MPSPLLAALTVLVSTVSASIRYDQTQTGGTNVHLQIKNVEVLALLDDIAGADYDYDYSEFTVKPPKPGGSSNSTNTTASTPTGGSSNSPNTTASSPTGGSSNSTADTASNSTVSTNTSVQPESVITTVASSSESPASSAPMVADESVVEAVTAPAKTRRCGAGFYRDTLGRCRRIRRPHLQMMVNLARSKTTESPPAS